MDSRMHVLRSLGSLRTICGAQARTSIAVSSYSHRQRNRRNTTAAQPDADGTASSGTPQDGQQPAHSKAAPVAPTPTPLPQRAPFRPFSSPRFPPAGGLTIRPQQQQQQQQQQPSSSNSSSSSSNDGSNDGSREGGDGVAGSWPTRRARPGPRGVPSSSSSSSSPGSSLGSSRSGSPSGPGSNLSSNPSSNSSSNSSWREDPDRRCPAELNWQLLQVIHQGGLQRLPAWYAWGSPSLLQEWAGAAAALPAAVDRLAAVSCSGPRKDICFDLETTRKRPCDLTELAAMAVDDQQQHFSSLCRPVTEISEDAKDLNGIDKEMVQMAPLLPAVLLQFVEWLTQQCEAAPGGSSTLCLVGHNIQTFDVHVLSDWAFALDLPALFCLLGAPQRLAKKKSKPLTWQQQQQQQWWQQRQQRQRQRQCAAQPALLLLDTLQLAKELQRAQLLPDGSNSLQALREYFKIPANEAHRALDDVAVNIQVYQRLQKKKLEQPQQPAQLQQQQQQQHLELAQPLQQQQLQEPLPAMPVGQQLPVLQLAEGQCTVQQIHQQQEQLQQELQQLDECIQQQLAQKEQLLAQQQQLAQKEQLVARQQELFAEQRQLLQEQSQQEQLQQLWAASEAPVGNGSSADDGSAISSSSSSSRLPVLDPAACDEAVARALEVLTPGDLQFCPAELAAAWAPFSQGLTDGKQKVFTPRQAQKLADAGFENLLQVVLFAPKAQEYSPAIKVAGVAGSSSAAVAGSSSSSSRLYGGDDDDEEVGEAQESGFQLVELQARLVRAIAPRSKNKYAYWMALFEVPANPPEAGPLPFKMTNFEYGMPSLALANCNRAFRQADALLRSHRQQQQQDQQQQQAPLVMLRGKVKQSDTPYSFDGVTYVWENSGTMELDFSPVFSSSSDGNSTDEEAADSAEPDAAGSAAAAAAGARGSSSGGRLLPQYPGKQQVKHGDWMNTGRGLGIIGKALEAIRASPCSIELLPEAMLQRYQMPGLIEALTELHQPTDKESLLSAKRRLAFQELMLVQMAQLLERYWLQRSTAVATTTRLGTAAVAVAVLAEKPPAATEAAAAAVAEPESAGAAAVPKRKRVSKKQQLLLLQQQQADAECSSGSDSGDEAGPWLPLQREAATAYPVSSRTWVEAAKQVLPYQLTHAQERVLQEVLADMDSRTAMIRLLQGDVGCGKTAVAILAALAAAGSGFQSVLLAPTELLATQHYAKLTEVSEQLVLKNGGVIRPRVALLTSSTRAAEKAAIRDGMAAGSYDVLVATQAALWVRNWANLALIVVDEQHRWGVKQREGLLQGLLAPPHMLLMTATPIPRTLALLNYGGMTQSVITSLPPGRTPVATRVVVDGEDARQEVYQAIHDELESGGRAYIVCSLVNENESMEGVRAATEEFERLSASGVFGGWPCALLHGKMSAHDKADVLQRFSRGDTPVLIASTVVEVGIDEPEASVMLVENAARFGLAQLHQLRGRVGRGSRASRCFLMAPPADAEGSAAAAKRLKVLERSHNGLDIAEADLKIRGAGDLFGTKQSGRPSMPLSRLTLRVLDDELELMEHARAAAAELLPMLRHRPELKAALLAYGLMTLQPGGGPPLLRDGVSGV